MIWSALTNAERQLSWNSTTRHGISPQCVHEVIGAQVDRTPDAIAVQVDDTTLTYRQLDDRAAVIASRLAQAGAGPGTVVAVLLDRTPDLVAAHHGNSQIRRSDSAAGSTPASRAEHFLYQRCWRKQSF